MKDELYHYQDIEDLNYFLTIDAILDVLKKDGILEGDRLPNEIALAEKTYTNRSSLREVIRVMEAFGIVDSRRGVGNILRNDTEKGFMNLFLILYKTKDMPLSDISKTRAILETEALREYLKNYTEEDVRKLEEIHRDMKEAYEDIERYLSCHMAFHDELLKYTDNEIVKETVHTAIRLLDNAIIRKREAEKEERNIGILRENDSHKKILEAIRECDSEKAAAVLKEHIEAPLSIMEKN